MKKGIPKFIVLIIACQIFIAMPAFSSEPISQDDMTIFKDYLSSTNNRKKAMERLLVAPTEDVYETALNILQNPKETIAMKNVVKEGMVRTHDLFALKEVQKIVFSNLGTNDIAKQICLSILWESSNAQEQERLAPELLHIAQNTRESDDVRRIAIGYLANSKITFSKNPLWAEQMALNKRETNAARTAAMNYLEYTANDSLNATLAKIMKDSRDNEQIRTITILRAARLQMPDLIPILESILADPKDILELRKTCLNMLLYYGFSSDEATFLKLVLSRERSDEMRALLQSSLDKLK